MFVLGYAAYRPEFRKTNPNVRNIHETLPFAQKLGFKVILDWVANHTAWDHPWVHQHPDWYRKNEKGEMAPYEASLIGNPVVDPEKPLEVLRTVHSFDPCLACAVHVHDASGNEVVKVKAL